MFLKLLKRLNSQQWFELRRLSPLNNCVVFENPVFNSGTVIRKRSWELVSNGSEQAWGIRVFVDSKEECSTKVSSFLRSFGACLSNSRFSDTGRSFLPVHGRGCVDRLGNPICDVGDVLFPSAREASTIIAFRWVQGCSWAGGFTKDINAWCLIERHSHRCGKRLTGSSVVIHLYQVAILDYEISGISEYWHGGRKAERLREQKAIKAIPPWEY